MAHGRRFAHAFETSSSRTLAMPDDVGRGSPTDSLTEEFLQAVEAVRTAGEQEPPPIDPDRFSGTDSPNR